ncbi:MAG TPA: hypothetical protein ENK43_16875 [Planctomycetes bacterium]|nr:hypothetical protein [Planctomycetota bacterium]
MRNPQVLILAKDGFHRRLLLDLARTNDLTVEASEPRSAGSWVAKMTAADSRPDIVLLDLDEPSLADLRALKALERLPDAERPFVAGWAHSTPASPGLDAFLPLPLDVGAASRTLAKLALNARCRGEVAVS